eukprot:GHVT01023644.1.p1 GENE.GHVT01023644.1~~GHVT01023644.1.p1  ORF type:complete len:172 (-),score=33.13 GHVT01023644.1:328-843(-)
MSRLGSASQSFDVGKFKQECRENAKLDMQKCIEHAIASDGAKDRPAAEVLVVNQQLKFAGQTIAVERRLVRGSKAYEAHQRRQGQRLGGTLTAVDELLEALKGSADVSSVVKSRIDWDRFKSKEGNENSLRSGHGYLHRRAFLQEADWQNHHVKVSAQRLAQEKEAENKRT